MGSAAGEPDLGELEEGNAFILSSGDARFGGISAAVWLGDILLLASDRGTLWRADAEFDGRGLLVGLKDFDMLELMPGRILDVESLAKLPDGRVLVAIEDDRQLHVVNIRAAAPVMASATVPPIDVDAPQNKGLEAVTQLDDGRILAIVEGAENGPGFAARILSGRESHPAVYVAKPHFQATAADSTEGEVFVLERRFGLFSGWQARIVTVDSASLPRADGMIEPHELASLATPMLIDNMEGLASRRLPDGRIALALVSDDNFNLLQETRLIELIWDPGTDQAVD